MIKRGDNKHRDEHDSGDGLYDLLTRLLLGSWTTLYPSLQERRVFFHKVQGDRERGDAEHGEEGPRLPVIERPRRKEQQRSHDEEEKQEPSERFRIQAVHSPNDSTRRARNIGG